MRLTMALPTTTASATSATALRVEINRSGDTDFAKGPFRWRLRGFHGSDLESVIDSSGLEVAFHRDGEDWVINALTIENSMSLNLTFSSPPHRKTRWSADRFWKILHTFHVNSHAVRQMKESGLDFASDLLQISPYRMEFTTSQIRLLVEEAYGCGFEWLRRDQDQDIVVWWNHKNRTDFAVRLSRCEWLKYFEKVDRGESSGQLVVIPHSKAVRGWKAMVNFADLLFIETGHDKTGRPESSARRA